MRVTHSAGGRHTAYIHAREGADPKSLEHIKYVLTENLMKWTPIEHDGEYVLEVRSIGKDGSKLLRLLDKEHAVYGNPRKEVNPENKIGLWQKMVHNTLRMSGLLYFIGDTNFLLYGWEKSFREDKLHPGGKTFVPQPFLAGIFYALGSPFISIFGTGDKSDVQLRHIAFDTLKYLEGKNINVPENSAIRSVSHKHNSTLWKRMISKAERYPAELANSFFALAGSMLIWEGAKELKSPDRSKKSILLDMGLGTMTVLAGLVSVFVDEEPRKPGEPRKKGLAGIWQWIEEKPLRTAGILLGLSSVNHAASTVIDYRNATKTLKDPNASAKESTEARKDRNAIFSRGVFVGSNLAAETLMALSSKGHGKGVESDSSLEPSTYAVMADMILRNPPDRRDQVLEMVSGYLSEKDNLNLDKEVIKSGIRGQIESMEHNPWLGIPAQKKAESRTEEENHSAQNNKWQNSVANSASSAISSPTI